MQHVIGIPRAQTRLALARLFLLPCIQPIFLLLLNHTRLLCCFPCNTSSCCFSFNAPSCFPSCNFSSCWLSSITLPFVAPAMARDSILLQCCMCFGISYMRSVADHFPPAAQRAPRRQRGWARARPRALAGCTWTAPVSAIM